MMTEEKTRVTKGRNRLNTTGFKGVGRYDKNSKRTKYCARIRHNGKRIFLGVFSTPEDAAKAYREKAAELHGEFACIG